MEGGLDIFQILLESGIVVKLVLLILIACSILSWAIIIQKRNAFNNVMKKNSEFLSLFSTNNNLASIHEQTQVAKDSSVGIMFKCGYDEYLKIKEKLELSGKASHLPGYISEHGITAIERSLKKGAAHAYSHLDKRLATLASIGSITPFIGLFGTVWGIIDSFAGLASGGGSIEAVAPGIAEALVATAVGLAAAIPAVWGYNVYTTKLGGLNSQMENFGQDFLNLIERNVLIQKEE